MKRIFKSMSIGTVAGFCNGLFGAGGGTIIVPAMERFLKVETHKAHASAIAVILPLSMASALLYVNRPETDWTAIAFISLGGIAGGVLGAKLLSKLSSAWLHKLFGLFMIAAAVRMIL